MLPLNLNCRHLIGPLFVGSSWGSSHGLLEVLQLGQNMHLESSYNKRENWEWTTFIQTRHKLAIDVFGSLSAHLP